MSDEKTAAPAPANTMKLQDAFNNITNMKRKFQGTGDEHSAVQQSIETIAAHLNAGDEAASQIPGLTASVKALTEQNESLVAKVKQLTHPEQDAPVAPTNSKDAPAVSLAPTP